MRNDNLRSDSNYSTIRLLSKVKPFNERHCGDKFETLLFSPNREGRKGEGGLRTRSLFKHSYKNIDGIWNFYNCEEQLVPVDGETNKKIEQYVLTLGCAELEIKELPLISVITVVFNGERYLRETIRSVLDQTYPNLEYIVIDGGSTDGTLAIIKEYEDAIDYWISEKDSGMYDALNKGFSLATGSLFAWLNSDDTYFNYTLRIVASVFTKYRIAWLTGIPSIMNERGEIIRVFNAKYFFQCLIRRGFYRSGMMGFIQQDSVFFSRQLFNKVGGIDSSFKLAGDYDLWIKFAEYEELYCIKTILASFRKHKNQISNDSIAYLAECDRARKPKFRILSRILLPLDILLSPMKCINPE